MTKKNIGEQIRLYLYKFFNVISAIVYYGLRVISVVAWLFVVNNIISAIFGNGNIWYKIAGSRTFFGNVVLWFLNNVYLKSEALQYFCVIMSSKAVWIGLLSSFGIRFGLWLYNFTRRCEYKHYLKMGYISNRPQVIVQNTGGNEAEMANMRAQIAEQRLEIERLKNAAGANSVSRN